MNSISQTCCEGGGSHTCDKHPPVCSIISTQVRNNIPPQPGHSHGLELVHCGFPTFVSVEAAQKQDTARSERLRDEVSKRVLHHQAQGGMKNLVPRPS